MARFPLLMQAVERVVYCESGAKRKAALVVDFSKQEINHIVMESIGQTELVGDSVLSNMQLVKCFLNRDFHLRRG